ncbi:MAG: VWA domain-containing protein [Thermoanaerobaculales bacterium]|nr:VWA domain-containing protein [Thermoanaerobaculales bacterium]
MKTGIFSLLFLLASTLSVSEEKIWVSIAEPRDGSFVMGEVLVVVDAVAAKKISEVEFFVDDRVVGVVTSAPYRLRIDLGAKNTPHRFKVVAGDVEGNTATDSITTQPVPIGGEISVELQQLYVTVSQDDTRVLDLKNEEFTVKDNGEKQKIVTFAIGDIPFTAALLIDASASMHGDKLAAATIGATAFVSGMQDLDHAKVLVFADSILNTTPFTDSKQVLSVGLSATQARGGTALHDHLYLALKLLEENQGRRVVVLLTDGVDTHSVLPMTKVFEKAQRSQALIYWIRLQRPKSGGLRSNSTRGLSSAWRNVADYRSDIDLLEKAVVTGGGKVYDVIRSEQIRPIFVEILLELREQYALGYYPSKQLDDGSWHRVRVKTQRSGLRIRTHEGYVDM